MFYRRMSRRGLVIFSLTASFVGCHRSARQIAATPSRTEQTCVYLFMGFGDRTWSGGLDKLASKLRDKDRYARVEPYRAWKSVVKEIVRERPEKVVLIGHSYGGDMAVRAARALGDEGVYVRLLVLMDAKSPEPIPANVDIAVHYYCVPTTFMFRGGPRDSLEKGNTRTRLTNVAVGRQGEVSAARNVHHTSLDDSGAIRKMIAEQITAAGG